MQEKTIKVYRFGELAPEVQAKLIQKCREDGVYNDFQTQDISEDFTNRLDELGYPDAKVYWSLGYCQGDGMAWEGTVSGLDLKVLLNRVFPVGHRVRRVLNSRVLGNLSLTVKHEGNYYHWNSMHVEIDNGDYNYETEAQAECIELLKEAVIEDVKDTSRTLEKEGYETIEYNDSEEVIRENIIANNEDTWYMVDGRVYHESWETDTQPPLPFEVAV